MTERDPTMTPKPMGFFSEWVVQVVWPDGHKQQVSAFRSEEHARGWIATESQAWLAERRRR